MKSIKLAKFVRYSFLFLIISYVITFNTFIKAQNQSILSTLEDTKWEAIQPDKIYSPALDESITRQFFCSFKEKGKIDCNVIPTASSKIKNEQYYDQMTRRIKYKQVFIPRKMFPIEHRIGTYTQNGSSVQIELSAYEIKAKIKANNMLGEVTLKLESNQETRWIAKLLDGENERSSSERQVSKEIKPLKADEFNEYAQAYLDRGDAKLESKNYREAVAEYDQVIRQCSISIAAWNDELKQRDDKTNVTLEQFEIVQAKSKCEQANNNRAIAKRLLGNK